VIMEAWRARAKAILMLWYPGMEGGHALADILLGRVNPSGRLPCTFPAHASDLPAFDRNATAITYDLWHGYRLLERNRRTAAFPFGFGLSYSQFHYRQIRLSTARPRPGKALSIWVDVTNDGPMAGDEVVQLYIATVDSALERPAKELKGFARVSLAAGETRAVRIDLPWAELAYYDPDDGWTVEPIAYEAIIARHAEDPSALRARFEVAAEG
jgi:beta-glucosidase